MNFLLLTIAAKKSQKMIYDIAEELTSRGNNLFIVCPADVENPSSRKFVKIDLLWYLFVDSGYSVGKVGLVKKVYNMMSIDNRYQKALKRAARAIDIDVVLYSTPPITLVNTISWCKKRFGAISYLMLKDIFPQNAVDLGMMKKRGVTAPIYAYFRKKEKTLYRVTDYIGCMSEANRKYILEHDSWIPDKKVGICVNSYRFEELRNVDAISVREKYGIPTDIVTFLYGGNLGKPQGLRYFIEVLKANANKADRFFVICGSGNDQSTITNYIEQFKPSNVLYMKNLPPEEFDVLTRACDVGMVFLDHRFTIPNFPSRMLSIMLNAKPILAATDSYTDVGDMIADADAGWWCESTDVDPMNAYIEQICNNPNHAKEKGLNARRYYEAHYTSEVTCNQILDGIEYVKNKRKQQL